MPADSPQLWRTGMLASYTGDGWQQPPLSALPRTLAAPASPGGFVAVSPSALDPVVAGGVTRTDHVDTTGATITAIASPGRVSALAVPSDVRVVQLPDGRLVPIGDAPGDSTNGPGSVTPVATSYQVTSTERPDVDSGGIASGSAAGRPWGGAPAGPDAADPGDPRWTQLPDTLPSRVRSLGVQLVRGQADRRAAVLAVADHLRASATYRLDSPVPAEGTDAVDDFLFVSRTGFCEQFASAEVVLLRAAGIPARLVLGFSGGRVQPDGATRLLRGTDAHAWVEVWFPGAGWVTSDPTAGTTLAAPSALDQARTWLARWWWALLLGAGALGLLVVTGVALARRRQGRAGADGELEWARRPGEAELVAAFARLEAGLEASGAARRPQESLAELERRLDRAAETAGQGPVPGSRALTVLERLTFAAVAPSETECRRAAADLDALAARLSEEAGVPAR